MASSSEQNIHVPLVANLSAPILKNNQSVALTPSMEAEEARIWPPWTLNKLGSFFLVVMIAPVGFLRGFLQYGFLQFGLSQFRPAPMYKKKKDISIGLFII